MSTAMFGVRVSYRCLRLRPAIFYIRLLARFSIAAACAQISVFGLWCSFKLHFRPVTRCGDLRIKSAIFLLIQAHKLLSSTTPLRFSSLADSLSVALPPLPQCAAALPHISSQRLRLGHVSAAGGKRCSRRPCPSTKLHPERKEIRKQAQVQTQM